MTLVLGLRCGDGIVLCADSQRTEGTMRDRVPKLFASPTGILWGTAGSIAIQQELDAGMQTLTVGSHPSAADGKMAIMAAVREARQRASAGLVEPGLAATAVQGLFAWYSEVDKTTYLLRVTGGGSAEFHPFFTAIGNGGELARFALSRSDYLGLTELPLDPAQMIAFEAADDVIRATATGLGPPVQVGVVTERRCAVVPSQERQALEDTVSVWRERKRAMLAPPERSAPPPSDTGVRP
jgi:20S proteasome alpha/beta subunit